MPRAAPAHELSERVEPDQIDEAADLGAGTDPESPGVSAEAAAQAKTTKDQGNQQPATKQRRSRRRKAADAEAPHMRFEGESVTFFDMLRSMSEAEWQHYLCYGYRMTPITDRRSSGGGLYIFKYGEPFDEEDIKKDHGSGGYKIRLNYTDPETGSSKTVQIHKFDILDERFPPKIPAGEWLDDQRNKKWAWARPKDAPASDASSGAGALGGTAEGFRAVREIVAMLKPEGGNGGASTDSVTRQVIDAMKTSHKEAWEMFQAQNKPADPMAQIQAIVGIMKLLQPPPPPPPPQNGPSDKLMELLIQQNTTLLAALTTKQSPVGNFTQMLTAIGEVRELFARGGPERSWWEEPISRLAESIGPMLAGSGAYMNRPAAAAAPAGAPPNAPPPAGGQPPGAGAPPAAPPPGGEQPPGAGAETDEQARQTFLQYRQMVLGLSGPLMQHLQNGQPGGDFAIWFVDGYGWAPYTEIKALGDEKILQLVQSIPELWSQLQPIQSSFRGFLYEFLNWKPTEEDDSGQEPGGADKAGRPQ